MNENLSLDQFLETQQTSGHLHTVEAVVGKDDHVLVTPWAAGVGCRCHLAVTVPRKAVESVRRTGERHVCCGKGLDVVEVRWAKGSSIPLDELFTQMAAAPAADSDQRHGGEDKPQPQPWRGSARIDPTHPCSRFGPHGQWGSCHFDETLGRCVQNHYDVDCEVDRTRFDCRPCRR